MKEPDFSIIPEHMRGAMKRYLEDGIPPGSFLQAVLCNDLKGAVSRADQINIQYLKEWAQFMMWELPAACQGSEERYRNWINMGGLNGRKVA